MSSAPGTVASAHRVHLRLLGTPALIAPDGTTRLLDLAAAATLALAALEPGMSRARIGALAWPASADPRGALRQLLVRLRRQWGFDVLIGRSRLSLAPGVTVDVTDAAAAGTLLSDLDVSALPGFAEWLEAQRQTRAGHARAQAELLLAQAQAAGDPQAARRLAEQLCAAEPARESTTRLLMDLHVAQGDVAQALAVFQRHAEHVRAERGRTPSAALQAHADALGRRAVVTATGQALPVAVLRPPRLIGRSAERAQLMRALHEGAVAWLLGEPGQGKSRLLDECRRELPAATVRVAARPGDAAVPFALLIRLLRSVLHAQPGLAARVAQTLAPSSPHSPLRSPLGLLLPELAPGVVWPSDGDRLLLQRAVEHLLREAEVPFVLLDDLHYADAASAELLQALLGGEVQFATRWAFAQRPGEGSAAVAALRDALAEGARVVEVQLAPLNVGEIAQLVDSLGLPGIEGAALAPRLQQRTGGNPLFVLELLKHGLLRGAGADAGVGDSPATVLALIGRRLHQLSPRALELARIVAVADVEFRLELAEQVLTTRALALADAWAELEAAQVLAGTTLAHDLVRDAVLLTLAPAQKRALHAAAAAFGERQAEADAAPARLALHWQAAGEPARALPHWLRAAGQARVRSQPEAQAEALEAAITCADAAGDAAAGFEVRLTLAYLLNSLRALPRQQVLLGELDQRAQQTGGALAQARVALVRASAQDSLGENEAAFDTAQRGEALLTALPDAAHAECRARLLLTMVQIASKIDRLAPILQHERELAALAQIVTDRELAAQIESALGIALTNADRPAEAAVHHARCLHLHAAQNNLTELINELANAATNARERGDFAEAARHLEDAERLHQSLGTDTRAYTSVLLARGHLARDRGRFDAALATLDQAQARVEPRSSAAVLVLHAQALAWLFVGQPARALQALAEAERGSAGYAWVPARTLWLRARVETSLGRPAGALLEQALACAPVALRRRLRWQIALDRAAQRDCDDGVARAEAVLAEIEAVRSPSLLLMAHTALAEITRAAGARIRAAAHGTEMLALLAQVEQPMAYRPALLWTAVQALQDMQPDRARQAAREAQQWIAAALPTVPSALQSTFLHQHPVNRPLAEWLQRAGG